MTGSVHIIIVNWNTGNYLKRCLASIAQLEPQERDALRVTVIDNASSDESATGVTGLGLPLEVTHNRANLGFAAACNQGASGSDADYLLFLNPDTELTHGALAATVAFMEGEEAAEVGICGAQVLDPRGRPAISCARFPTLRVLFGKMTALSRIFPRLFPSHHLGPDETRESRFVDQVIGAFFLVRRELFVSLGGFDTQYFIYYEEVDFAARARDRDLGPTSSGRSRSFMRAT